MAPDGDLPWLLPVGVLPGREVLLVDWRELGHVLVAGLPGEGAETVLTSLAAALAARCRPAELELRTIAHRRTFPPEIGRLPHQRGRPIEPGDRAATETVIEEVRTEGDGRAPARDDAVEEAAGETAPTAELLSSEPIHVAADATEAASGDALAGAVSAAVPVQDAVPSNGNGHRSNGRAHQAALVLPATDGETADPPLRVICFGGPRILCRGQQVWSSDVIDKFKHWEVLVFLAAQRSGMVSRDILCDRLWGESGPKDIEHALNQHIHRLRQEVREAAPGLPGQFVVVHRNGRCTLDPAVVWSDVHRFVALCEEGKTLPDEQAKEAFAEARALFRCYRQLGDRGALVREERHLREVLQELSTEETDPSLAEPEPKTTALFQQILSELEAKETAPAAG